MSTVSSSIASISPTISWLKQKNKNFYLGSLGSHHRTFNFHNTKCLRSLNVTRTDHFSSLFLNIENKLKQCNISLTSIAASVPSIASISAWVTASESTKPCKLRNNFLNTRQHRINFQLSPPPNCRFSRVN